MSINTFVLIVERKQQINIKKGERKMKVIQAFGPKNLQIVEVPLPEPGSGYVRIKVRASGICGSDKWIWHVKKQTVQVAGHEVAGEVEKLGEGVTSLAIGDRVMINNVVGCGRCSACRAGEFVLCHKWDGSLDVNNGFGEYLVAPARNSMKILPGLDFIDGSLMMDNWGTPYGGIKLANMQPGMDVLVAGCGPVGLAAIGLSKAMGAHVIAVDPIPWRRQFALQCGADSAFAPEELPDAAKAITDGAGVHAVLECSGNGTGYENCLKSLQIGGNMIVIGEHAEYNLHPSDLLIRRRLGIKGSWYSTLPQAGEVMQLALQGRVKLKSFLTQTVTLDKVPEIFGSMINCEEGFLKCVIVFE